MRVTSRTRIFLLQSLVLYKPQGQMGLRCLTCFRWDTRQGDQQAVPRDSYSPALIAPQEDPASPLKNSLLTCPMGRTLILPNGREPSPGPPPSSTQKKEEPAAVCGKGMGSSFKFPFPSKPELLPG